jgi:hypothetical protein
MRTSRNFHRTAGVLGFVASLIAIFAFVTGRQTIADLFANSKEPLPINAPTPTASPTPQGQVNTSAPIAQQPVVSSPPSPPIEAPQIPSGSLPFNRQVAVFGSGFYGRHTPLILQTVENVPGSRLSLHFLVENEDKADYYFTLSNPSDTAVAIDDARGYYSFLSAENIDSVTPITVPAGGRRNFTISFQPLTAPRTSLLVRLSFDQQRSTSAGFSVSGQASVNTVRIEIPDIPIHRFNG